MAGQIYIHGGGALRSIVATIWLAVQALSCAMALTAFFGSIGAVTAADTFAATLGGIDDILDGKPLVEIYN